jgi:FKBP-type peptidyl-prolyl cis-trans isomerase
MAVSHAALTEVSQPGGPAFFFGKHTVTASYAPGGNYSSSSASKSFSVNPPAFSTLASGVKIATTVPGFGPQIQSGQSANVQYTGYLASSGQLFDDSASHGGAPLNFVLGSGQLIPGFDAGTAGMQVGETRIIEIPPSQGYGSTANGSIPANSTLIFVVTLESIG